MRVRETSFLFLLTAGMALLARGVGACVDLDSLGNGVRDDGGGPSDSAEPPETGPSTPDPCAHAGPAGRPTLSEPAGPAYPDFIVAVKDVILDSRQAEGFDLDGVCTCEARPATAFDGGNGCASAVAQCDLDGGADNALGTLAGLVSTLTESTAIDKVTEGMIAAGRRTLLVQIREYDGKPNDGSVIVSLLLGEGLRSTGCDGGVVGDGGFVAPVWCGDDLWSVSPQSVVGVTPALSAEGWVTNGQLVANFLGDAILPVTESTSLRIERPTLTGKLVPLGEDLLPRGDRPPTEKEKRLFRIEAGLLAGRTATENVLTALGGFAVQESSAPLCTRPAFASTIITNVCFAADLSAAAATDRTNAPCKALSVGVGLTAEPAMKGPVSTDPLPTNECSPGNVDASLYQCR